MDYSEKWGTSVEEAVRLALVDLKLTREEVNVTVLEEPSRGFFGIGSKLAKVRVEKIAEAPKVEKTEEKKPETVKTADKKQEVKESRPRTEHRQDNNRPDNRQDKRRPQKDKKPYNSNTGKRRDFSAIEEEVHAKSERLIIRERPDDLVLMEEGEILNFLREVTEKMGLTLSIKAYHNEASVYIDIQGKDSGTIIGKRGQTLDALQYLASLVVNKNQEKYKRVVIDAENYREKRERTLEQLANRLADKVRRTGKSVRLEPMNPYERKVIHATLQSRKDVVTRSEGEEPYRRVIIELK